MAVTAAATMITKPSTLRNGLIEIPAMRRPEACKESHASKCRATPMNSPDAGPTQRVDQLRILGRERGFHLLEKPLLLI